MFSNWVKVRQIGMNLVQSELYTVNEESLVGLDFCTGLLATYHVYEHRFDSSFLMTKLLFEAANSRPSFD